MGRPHETNQWVGASPTRRWRGQATVLLSGLFWSLGACSVSGDLGGGTTLTGNGNSTSPTGTFLDPRERDGSGASGYDVLDEACEDVLDPYYLERFETPMFRGVAHHGQVAHLVDGGQLWSVSLLDPSQPRRLSRTRLPGHPLKIAATAGGLLVVAAGKAGVHLLAAEDATTMAQARVPGEPGSAAPLLLATLEHGGLALDVALLAPQGDAVEDPGDASPVEDPTPDATALAQRPLYAVVAAGAEGLMVLELPSPDAAPDATDVAPPQVVAAVPLPGFATAVDVDGRIAWVAACRLLVAVDLTDPYAPRVLEAYSVPLGHARGIFAKDGQVLVAGGEALFAYDGQDPLEAIWTGYYAEPEVPGFYVNDVVARDGIAYIAAGDEAVRSLDLRMLSSTAGFPAPKAVAPQGPGLDAPAELPPPDEQPGTEPEVMQIRLGDPIGVTLLGDLLMVLGNFRWLGERTLRLMSVDGSGQMVDLASYVQPRIVKGLSALEGALVVHGGDSVETILPTGDASPTRLALPAPAERWVADQEGLWLLTEQGDLLRYQHATSEVTAHGPLGLIGFDLAARSHQEVYLSDQGGGQILEMAGPLPNAWASPVWSPAVTFPGETYLATGESHLYVYEWLTGLLHTIRTAGLAYEPPPEPLRLGLCEGYDIADFFTGRQESRVRLVRIENRLWVLCPHDARGGSSVLELDLSSPGAPQLTREITLTPARYTDFAVVDGGVYTLAFDNNRYESVLTGPWGAASASVTFDGAGLGLLRDSDHWHVADADVGLRLYTLEGTQWLALGVLPLGQEE